MRTGRVVLAALLAAVILQTLYYYPQLPSTVASHFGSGGRPNGWSSKETFFGIHLGITALLLAAFLGIPTLIRHVSLAWINLPNKEYWLAPERRDRAILLLSREMLWFGNVTIAFLISVIQLAIQANLSESGRLSEPAMWSLLGAYFLYVAVWMIRFYRKFARPR